MEFLGQIYSVDSAKAIKAREAGYLNGIQYMAPATMAGVGNLCPHASKGCIAVCLGEHSGQAAMTKKGETTNPTLESRKAKARGFMKARAHFVGRLVVETARLVAQASRMGLRPCARLNGSSDIAWEGIRVDVDAALVKACARLGVTIVEGRFRNLFEVFPTVPFVDYTKNPHRMLKQADGRYWPQNYHLTFSRSESNDLEAFAVLKAGGNVAIVFGESLPAEWHGFTVIDGDKTDLRHLDPKGVVVGLLPKGLKAKRDRTSGFVVWGA